MYRVEVVIHRNKHRNSLEIQADILAILSVGCLMTTHLVYKANLSGGRTSAKKYLDKLSNLSMIEKRGKFWYITPVGIAALEKLRAIVGLS